MSRARILPRRAIALAACFLGLLVPSLLSAQGWGTLVNGGISRVAQDGDMRLWGMVVNECNMIHLLTADGWGGRELPGYHHLYRAVAVENFLNGDVGCLWHNEKVTTEQVWLLTRHRGEQSRSAKVFRASLHEPSMRGLKDGRVVITDSSPTLVTVFPDDKESEVITLPERLFIPPQQVKGDATLTKDHAPLRTMVDSTGGVWLWSPEVRHDPARWRLGGLVKLGNAPAEPQLCPLGEGAPLVSAVRRWDDGHFVVAVVGRGIYLLDLGTLEMKPMSVPDGDAFKYVEQLFHDGTAWHAVTMPQPSELEAPLPSQYGNRKPVPRKVFYDRAKPTCALWRYEAETWKMLHEGLDKDPAMSRPWLRISSGLFVGSDAGPPWFFPSDGSRPRRIAAASAFPLAKVDQMFSVNQKQLLFQGGEERSTCLWPASATDTTVKPLRWEKFAVVGKPLRDARGHIWCLREDNTLTRWDGSEWRKFSPPPVDAVSVTMGFFSDDRDRGWLLPSGNDPTAVCDFATGEWQKFPTLRNALEAQLAHPMKLSIPEFPSFVPAFSDDGRIGAFTTSGNIALFENREWREWRISEITGASNSNLAGIPFFAPGGKFSVPFDRNVIWQWQGDAQGWQSTGGITVPHPGIDPDRESVLVPQVGDASGGHMDRGVRDNHGAVWVLRPGFRLVKFVSGREANVFGAEEPHPFDRNSCLYRVVVDDAGNGLLDIGRYGPGNTQIFIRARYPVPKSSVQLASATEESARLKLGSDDTSAWHAWKLDDGKWQELCATSELVLENLSLGKHIVEVRAYNAELTPSPTTATLSFEITSSPGGQLDADVLRLVSADLDEREAASRRLKRQGAAVLPRLLEARKTASPDVQWWLDAIIQHIERQPASAPK